jgi:ABC-type transporter Mla maintaining outer membrane lipid asymmetry permease subunit MlaE
VALTLIKELGPVVTALLFAGRAGTSLASEIGLMRATDQLAAMEVMAIDPDPAHRCAPFYRGVPFSVPLLTAVFNAIGILGAWFIGVYGSWAWTAVPSGRRCRSTSIPPTSAKAYPKASCLASQPA